MNDIRNFVVLFGLCMPVLVVHMTGCNQGYTEAEVAEIQNSSPEEWRDFDALTAESQADLDAYLEDNDLDLNLKVRVRQGSRDMVTGVFTDHYDLYLDGRKKFTKTASYHVEDPDSLQLDQITLYGRDADTLICLQIHQDLTAFGLLSALELEDLGTVNVASYTDVQDVSVPSFIEVYEYRHTPGVSGYVDGDILGYYKFTMTKDVGVMDFETGSFNGVEVEWVAEIPPGYES